MKRFFLTLILSTCLICTVSHAADTRENAITNTAGATVSFSTSNQYEWEWDGTNNRLRSTNYKINSSTSQTTITIINTKLCNLSFDYAVSSESTYDKLTITLDGTTIVNAISGEVSDSYGCELSNGTHTLVLKYVKDGSMQQNDDRAYISNVVLNNDKRNNVITSNTAGASVSFSTTNQYEWEWDGTNRRLRSTNYNINGSTSITFISISNSNPCTLSFDYAVSSLSYYDKLTIKLDGITIADAISGIQSNSYCVDLTSGDHYLSLMFENRYLTHTNDDRGYLSNLKLEAIRSINWSFNSSTGQLTISGVGDMDDYASSSSVPWHIHKASIKSIVIENGVTSIGENAFYGCSQVESVTIPNSVTRIGTYAFVDMDALTQIQIPNSVTEMGEAVFGDCDNLREVVLPNCISEIKSMTFADCLSLESIVIPSSVRTIGETAFGSCKSLESVEIPYGVATIGERAFASCIKLNSLSIPSSVTTIGESAFFECNALRSVTCFCETLPTTPYDPFFRISDCSLITLYVPFTSISLYKASTVWNKCNIKPIGEEVQKDGIKYLIDPVSDAAIVYDCTQPQEEIIIPSYVVFDRWPYDVTHITDDVFYNKEGISKVVLPSTITSIGSRALYGAVEVICNATTPPVISANTFNPQASARVPKGTKPTYRLAQYWATLSKLFVIEDEHDFNDVVWEWTGTERATATLTCKNDEEEVFHAEATIESVEVTPVSCSKKGVVLYIAKAVFEDLEGKPEFVNTKEIYISELPHTMTIIDNNDGTHTKYCTVCGGNRSTETHYQIDVRGYCSLCHAVSNTPDTNVSTFAKVVYASKTTPQSRNEATIDIFMKSDIPMTGVQFQIDIPFADMSDAVVSYPSSSIQNVSLRDAYNSHSMIKVLCYSTDGEYLNFPGNRICTVTFSIPEELPYNEYPMFIRDIHFTKSGVLYEVAENIKSSVVLSENMDVCGSLNLVDGTDYRNMVTKQCESLTFTKTFSASAANKWNAFYVPMSIDVDDYAGELDFAEIYAFCATVDTNGDGTVDADDENFLFVRPVKTGCISPNLPYLIRPHEAKTYTISSADNILHAATEGQVEFSTTRDHFTVTGLNEAFVVTAGDNNYYVTGSGTLSYRANGSTTVRANRWVMHREAKQYGSSSSGNDSRAKEFSILALGEDLDEATAIKMIEMSDIISPTDKNVYTLDGRKVNAASLSKGIYIKNGKKYIVK